MRNWMIIIISILLLTCTANLNAQYDQENPDSKKYFVGSTFFVLGNFAKVNRPDFVQLNLGYRFTNKDAISLELKTWKYAWPLGIPYGEHFEAPGEGFPGHIREYGFAIAYQHFWWKGLYSGIHVMNAWQSFADEEGNQFDDGFQIFNTYRLGYHVKLFNDRFFIEPSIAITHRPFGTKMPDAFEVVDNKWSKFFFGEPGLHFGVNF